MATDRFDVLFNSRVCEVLPSGFTRHPVNTSHNSYRHDRPMNKTDRSHRMLVFDDTFGPGSTRQLCEPSCISNDDELTAKPGFTRQNGCRNPVILQAAAMPILAGLPYSDFGVRHILRGQNAIFNQQSNHVRIDNQSGANFELIEIRSIRHDSPPDSQKFRTDCQPSQVAAVALRTRLSLYSLFPFVSKSSRSSQPSCP